jgi:hypothetical protein
MRLLSELKSSNWLRVVGAPAPTSQAGRHVAPTPHAISMVPDARTAELAAP